MAAGATCPFDCDTGAGAGGAGGASWFSGIWGSSSVVCEAASPSLEDSSSAANGSIGFES
jgi:hypothetical protein